MSSSGNDSVTGTVCCLPQQRGAGNVSVTGTNPYAEVAARTNALWLRDYDPRATGFAVEGFPIKLYDSTPIIENDPIDLNHFDRKCFEHDSHFFYLDSFFQMRLYKKKQKQSGAMPTGPKALTEAWNWFINEYKSNPSSWRLRLQDERQRYYNSCVIGRKMRVHQLSVASDEGLCAVAKEQECPLCYKESKKSRRTRLEQPTKLALLMMDLKIHIDAEFQERQELIAKESQDIRDSQLQVLEDFDTIQRNLMIEQQVSTALLNTHMLRQESRIHNKRYADMLRRMEDVDETIDNVSNKYARLSERMDRLERKPDSDQ